MRVLIAEDNAALARVIGHTLRQRGFDVEVARDGAEAWSAAEKQAFDLIVTDHQMPRLTGLEVCQRVRAAGPNRETPVVLLTAKGMELDAETVGEEYGVAEVMIKPFSPSVLGEVAERHAVASA